MLSRRQTSLSLLASVMLPKIVFAQSESNPSPGANFVDVFAGDFHRGVGDPQLGDINTVTGLIASDYLPRDDPYAIMLKLSELGTPLKPPIREANGVVKRYAYQSVEGPPFNQRWPNHANPLIVRFFHDLDYPKLQYPGDCTPWCAATLGWCLQRAGYRLPPDPASSQSYRNSISTYGLKVSEPRYGDICVFTDVNDSSHGHVAFYVSRTASTVKVLGGNQIGHGPTNCGPGYPQTEIGLINIPINSERKRSIGVHYLYAYVRPLR